MEPSAGSTPLVTDVATVQRAGLAWEAGHSKEGTEPRAYVLIALRLLEPLRSAERDAWGRGCSAGGVGGSVCSSELEVVGPC